MGEPNEMLAGADLLDLAADEIEVCGWYRGYTSSPGISTFTRGQPCCPVSAMARVGHYDAASHAASIGLRNLLAPGIDPWEFDIVEWNDRQTDPWVVLDAMRQAARNLRILYESVTSWHSA